MTDRPLLVAAVMVLGGAFALLIALALATWVWERRAEPAEPPRPARAQRRMAPRAAAAVRQEWQRLTAYASAAAERAAWARAEAAAAVERSAAAETVRDVAWHEYETAESPLVSVPAAAAAPEEAPDAGARQGLAHAAFVAFRRGAITVRELQQVWGGTAKADPEQAERRRVTAERSARQRAYQRAATAARLAQEQALVAEVAAQALTAEAAEAEREALAAQAAVRRYWPPATAPRR